MAAAGRCILLTLMAFVGALAARPSVAARTTYDGLVPTSRMQKASLELQTLGN